MTKGVIFDMDGTLFDTGEGIKSCINYATAAIGMPPVPDDKLDLFIGPSLFYSFTQTAGFTEDVAFKAIEAYRERYAAEGIYMSYPYKGIPELIKKLHGNGYILSVASSKPLVMVNVLLDKYGYTKYFTKVIAPDFARRSSNKRELIESAVCADKSVMVGDSVYDVGGAHEAGIKAIAVTYGYGSREEIADADAFAASPEEIYTLLENGKLFN